MNIYVPYVTNNGGPHSETAAFLKDKATFVNLTGDDGNYFRLVKMLWKKQEDFTIVEQDILPAQKDLDDFDSCPEVWCCNPYDYEGKNGKSIAIACLGCTRFRKGIIEQVPNLFEIIASYDSGTMSWNQFHWVHLDGLIWRTLFYKFGLRAHIHDKVIHFHKYLGRSIYV